MRLTALLAAALVAASVVAAAGPVGAAPSPEYKPGGGVQAAAAQAENATDDANGSTAPGAVLSGVVGVQKAEIDGEVEARALGVRFAAAASNRSKAAVVAEQAADLEARLAELRERERALREARRNGSIDEGRFRAEMARLAAEIATVERLANRTASASAGLPADLLRERGVNVTAIQRLRSDAANLSGPEVARIARSIAGPSVGSPMARGPPDDVGPPGDVPGKGPANETDRGPPGNASERGDPRGNASDRDGGPDDTPGNESRGDGAGNESGPPDDGGQGDGQGDGSDTGNNRDDGNDDTDRDADETNSNDDAKRGDDR